MSQDETIEYNGDKEKLPASADEALLDEFFSLVATIAMRLTRGIPLHKNNSKNSKEEGEKL